MCYLERLCGLYTFEEKKKLEIQLGFEPVSFDYQSTALTILELLGIGAENNSTTATHIYRPSRISSQISCAYM